MEESKYASHPKAERQQEILEIGIVEPSTDYWLAASHPEKGKPMQEVWGKGSNKSTGAVSEARLGYWLAPEVLSRKAIVFHREAQATRRRE